MFDKTTMDAIVKGAIIGAMGEDRANQLLNDIITKLLTVKVNKHGSEIYDSHGGGHPDTPFLDYVVQRQLRTIVEHAVMDYVKDRSEEITNAVKQTLINDAGIANGISKLIESQITNGSMTIDVNFKPYK